MRALLLLVLVAAALAVPTGALAQTPSDDTYDPPPTDSSSRGSIPFGGLELGLVLVVGTGLLGMGVAIRHAARSSADGS